MIPRRDASSSSSRGKFLTLNNQKENETKIKIEFQGYEENNRYQRAIYL
jgi:hypothetical protein